MNKLINGDCLDVLSKLNMTNFIFVSDPPFNVGYKYNEYNDNKKEDDYFDWLSEIFKTYPQVIVHYPESLYKYSFQIGLFPDKVISWVYNSNTQKQHRDIAFFGIKPNMKQVRQPYKNPNDKRIKERIKNGSKGAKLYDWWEINQVKNVSKEKTEHPCQMPLKVMENIIGLLPYNITIIDPFMGSGTTGVAVKNMNIEQGANRNFIGIELNKEYYDIAVDRINDVKPTLFDKENK